MSTAPETDLSEVLDSVRAWFARFVCTATLEDLDLLTLWAAHTHVCLETWTTPRLILDSLTPGSGKTTVLDHLSRLAYRPVMAASLNSAALIARLMAGGPRTLLIDEVDRSLDPKNPNTGELLAVLNSGYRVGQTRPVLEKAKEGGWVAVEMPTFGPVVMAGNAPNLPQDTRDRSVRLLLMRDVDGVAEDSDWEEIEPAARALGEALADCLDRHRDDVHDARPALPEGCRGRMKEKWRPLARVAKVAGGRWPEVARILAVRDLEEVAAEQADGVAVRPPAVVLLADLAEVWDEDEAFLPTARLIDRLINHHPDYWSAESAYGSALTPQRLSRLLTQGGKIRSTRDSAGRRGYMRAALHTVWRNIAAPLPMEPTEPTEPTEPPTSTHVPGGSGDSGGSVGLNERGDAAGEPCSHGGPPGERCGDCERPTGPDPLDAFGGEAA